MLVPAFKGDTTYNVFVLEPVLFHRGNYQMKEAEMLVELLE